MTLLEAKDAAKKESRATKGKVFFVTVSKDGECDLTSNKKTKELVAHAYNNGSEIAVPSEMNNVSEPAAKGTADSGPNNPNSKNMAKAAAKKAAKKTAKSKEPKEKKVRGWPDKPYFGFKEDEWKKVVKAGKDAGLGMSAFVRKAVFATHKGIESSKG